MLAHLLSHQLMFHGHHCERRTTSSVPIQPSPACSLAKPHGRHWGREGDTKCNISNHSSLTSVSVRFRFGSYSVISQSPTSCAILFHPSRPSGVGSASFGSGLVATSGSVSVGFGFIWRRFQWRLRLWGELIWVYVRLRFPSRLGYSPRRFRFLCMPIISKLNLPALLHPVPSLPFHSVPSVSSRSVRFQPMGASLAMVMVHFRSHSWSRLGFGSVSVRFQFGSYSAISQSRASCAVRLILPAPAARVRLHLAPVSW